MGKGYYVYEYTEVYRSLEVSLPSSDLTGPEKSDQQLFQRQPAYSFWCHFEARPRHTWLGPTVRLDTERGRFGAPAFGRVHAVGPRCDGFASSSHRALHLVAWAQPGEDGRHRRDRGSNMVWCMCLAWSNLSPPIQESPLSTGERLLVCAFVGRWHRGVVA